MVCGYPPFNGENDKEIADNILTKEPEIPEDIDNELRDLIKRMLTKNPD